MLCSCLITITSKFLLPQVWDLCRTRLFLRLSSSNNNNNIRRPQMRNNRKRNVESVQRRKPLLRQSSIPKTAAVAIMRNLPRPRALRLLFPPMMTMGQVKQRRNPQLPHRLGVHASSYSSDVCKKQRHEPKDIEDRRHETINALVETKFTREFYILNTLMLCVFHLYVLFHVGNL